MLLRVFLACLTLGLVTGCNSSGIYPVSGKVTFTDGPMPEGEIKIVHFEPVRGSTKKDQFKPASGRIQPDGSYQLTTVQPDDGAFVGDYKVTFTMRKEYMGTGSLIDSKYTTADKTPYSATVKAGGPNKFDFELTRAPGT